MALTSRVDENRALRTYMPKFCEPADKIVRLTLIHLRLLIHVKNAESEYSKLWIYIHLLIFKIFQGSFSNAVLHDVSMRWIIENYTRMDKKVRWHMEWKKKLEIVYDAFDKGLGIRPIARKYGVSSYQSRMFKKTLRWTRPAGIGISPLWKTSVAFAKDKNFLRLRSLSTDKGILWRPA